MSLKGKTLVFTGAMQMKRAECTAMATAAGATVTGSVSGKTNIVVAGPDGILIGACCRITVAARYSHPAIIAVNT